MTIQIIRESARFIASSRNILRLNGLDLTVGSDFEEYAEIVRRERPMQALGAPFDPNRVKLTSANSFWLVGRNSADELIHTQACRVVPLRGKNLGNYLMRSFRDYPPAVPDLDLKRSRYRATPGAHRIDGTVVYHGEVWMAPEKGMYRGSGLSTVMARSGLLEAMQKWDPDWLFGFMAQNVAFKGFAERMGYMHNEPGALRWYREGNDRPMEGFLSYLSRDELNYLLEMPVDDIVAQAA